MTKVAAVTPLKMSLIKGETNYVIAYMVLEGVTMWLSSMHVSLDNIQSLYHAAAPLSGHIRVLEHRRLVVETTTVPLQRNSIHTIVQGHT